MDFITGFPVVNTLGSILVVVDCFSKYVVLLGAPVHFSTDAAADMFLRGVVKHFGLPIDIISDRDTQFTGRFSLSLIQKLQSKLKFSTTNHPQLMGRRSV